MMTKFSTFAHDYWPIYRTWQFNTPVIHLLLPEHVEVSELKRGRYVRVREAWSKVQLTHTARSSGFFVLRRSNLQTN
jgi:hypothetical protein